MNYLATFSLTASILYFYVGLHAIRSNRRSRLCRIFFWLTLSMTVWSFGQAFVYLAKDAYEYSFWNKTAAFGWCTFEALTLYFVLVLTSNKWINYWYIKLLILMPAFVFLYMALFLFGPDISTNQTVSAFFYIGDFIYNCSYLAVGILMIYLWGHRSKVRIQRKQAYIISICSIIPFLLNLFEQEILPALHIIKLPNMGQLFTLIMLLGVYYAITKYQFMSIPSSLIANELFNELTGLTLLVDSGGCIMKANKQVYQLLHYNEDEIIGKYITDIIKNDDTDKILAECDKISEKLRFMDIDIFTKSGMPISFHISIIPLFTSKKILGGVLVIGEDIRATKRLEEEIERHRITNKKLQNNEMMFRTILEMAPVSIILVRKNTRLVLYLNSQAEELFGSGGLELIGWDVSDFFMNAEDGKSFIDSFIKNEKVSNREIQMIKRDGKPFIGLVTIIPSIYHEEEVALFCIIDITERKNVEEKLKQNNLYIHNLNKELVYMNSNLMNKSIRDGLTGLYNHQYINEVLEKKLSEASEGKENICLMMLDIDHFKRVNDQYGHITGDKVLQTVAELLLKNTRNEDRIGRYGGEEFIVILSGIELKAAAEIAENIRCSIYYYDYGIENLKVSISIGVARYEGEGLTAFINKADKLLYLAKANGRNKVECTPDK